ncbi:MAG: tetratricopeptide repeat protein [Candidatus Omnitrophica bacterium]|nr:tetratricopeptide repeat protein [Candidatus Omnitrophota bacterium]
MTEEEAKKIAQEIFSKAYDLQMAGELEDAIEQYKRSIEIYPTAEAHTFLGWTYSFQGRYDEAIQECRRAIKIDPDFGNPYNDIGAYLIERGKLDEAIPWFQKAMTAKRYDNYCYPHYNLGRVYEQKGNWLEALKCYEASLKANSNYTLARKALNRLKALFN